MPPPMGSARKSPEKSRRSPSPEGGLDELELLLAKTFGDVPPRAQERSKAQSRASLNRSPAAPLRRDKRAPSDKAGPPVGAAAVRFRKAQQARMEKVLKKLTTAIRRTVFRKWGFAIHGRENWTRLNTQRKRAQASGKVTTVLTAVEDRILRKRVQASLRLWYAKISRRRKVEQCVRSLGTCLSALQRRRKLQCVHVWTFHTSNYKINHLRSKRAERVKYAETHLKKMRGCEVYWGCKLMKMVAALERQNFARRELENAFTTLRRWLRACNRTPCVATVAAANEKKSVVLREKLSRLSMDLHLTMMQQVSMLASTVARIYRVRGQALGFYALAGLMVEPPGIKAATIHQMYMACGKVALLRQVWRNWYHMVLRSPQRGRRNRLTQIAGPRWFGLRAFEQLLRFSFIRLKTVARSKGLQRAACKRLTTFLQRKTWGPTSYAFRTWMATTLKKARAASMADEINRLRSAARDQADALQTQFKREVHGLRLVRSLEVWSRRRQDEAKRFAWRAIYNATPTRHNPIVFEKKVGLLKFAMVMETPAMRVWQPAVQTAFIKLQRFQGDLGAAWRMKMRQSQLQPSPRVSQPAITSLPVEAADERAASISSRGSRAEDREKARASKADLALQQDLATSPRRRRKPKDAPPADKVAVQKAQGLAALCFALTACRSPLAVAFYALRAAAEGAEWSLLQSRQQTRDALTRLDLTTRKAYSRPIADAWERWVFYGRAPVRRDDRDRRPFQPFGTPVLAGKTGPGYSARTPRSPSACETVGDGPEPSPERRRHRVETVTSRSSSPDARGATLPRFAGRASAAGYDAGRGRGQRSSKEADDDY